jgi:RimJ/RimL family protein N-acetyltransferase
MLLEKPTPVPQESCCVVLETERLVLRRPTLADVKAIARLANDRRIAQNTSRIPHPYAVSDAETFIQFVAQQPRDTNFVILRDGDLVGNIGIDIGKVDAPEIGYWLGVPYWNKGYATEALHALIDYAFTDLTHDAVQAGARVTNPASRRVLEKCGFQWTGVGLYRINSIKSSAPIDRFRLERRIWSALKTWGRAKRVS